MKKISWLVGGIVGVLVGLGLVFPAVAQMRNEGALPTLGVCLLLIGLSLCLAGGRMALSGLRSPKT
jgi:hypothetical protein